jgi:hypothetical protein
MGNPESWNILASIMNAPYLWISICTILVVLEYLAVMRVLRSASSRESKCLWILIIVFVPIIGLLAWLVAGRKSSHATR